MQKSALRTTLLLAFLSMAPVAVPAPPNNNSTEEAACQLLVANMDAEDALGEALKTQEKNYRQYNPNAGNNPESVMGLQQVVRTYWPTIFDLYQKCFGKLDTSSPDNLYTTFLAQSLNTGQVALDKKITIRDLQKGLQRTEQYLNNDKDLTLNYNCSTDYLKQMLAVANALREKNEEPFQQQINEILAEYSRQGTTDCLAGLNARLFQPIVGGIQAYLSTVCLYYCKVFQAEKDKNDAKKNWPSLKKDYEKIFGAFNAEEQNTTSKNKDFLGYITNNAPNFIETMQKAGKQNESIFLQDMIRVNKDLDSKYADSYTDAIQDAALANDETIQKKEESDRLGMTLLTLALGCMKHQLSKTFGGNPEALLQKIKTKEKPKNTPLTPPQTSSFSHQPVPTPQTYTPASLPQNARPTTKPRTIFPAPDRQNPSAFFQPPVNPQPFHRTPATVLPLYAQSPNNTPQTSPMHTQVPTPTPPPFMPQTPTYSPYTLNTLPPVSRLDSVDGVNVTTPQIGSFPHQPVSAPQTYTPTSSWQHTSPEAASPGPFDQVAQRATTAYRRLREQSKI